MVGSKQVCQNCKQSFTIGAEDFAFYERIEVPPPTFCWRCRLQRRLAARPSGRVYYKVQCGLCKERVVSSYPPDSPFPIFCSKCWHGDHWDSMSYGRGYDYSKPFFKQFRELIVLCLSIAIVVATWIGYWKGDADRL